MAIRKITFPQQVSGDRWTTEKVNEIKDVVNSNADRLSEVSNEVGAATAELRRTVSKGIFLYGTNLSTAVDSPRIGEWCVVLGSGNVFPGTVYTYNGTTWTAGGSWSPNGTVDLADYPTKAEMEATIEEHAVKIADNLETQETGKVLDARQGFVLAGQISEITESMMKTWPAKEQAEYGGWVTTTKLTINAEGIVTKSGATSTSYRVAYLVMPLKKGTVVRFTAKSTSNRTQRAGFTTIDPSTLESLDGLKLDNLATMTINGDWDWRFVVPYDNAYLVLYYYNASWSGRTFGFYSPDGARAEIDALLFNSMEHKVLDELNTQTNKIYSEGKVVLVSTGDEGFDAYFVGDGTNYLTNTGMKFLGRGMKETVLGTYSKGGVGNKAKGTYINNTTGIVVNGTQNGSDVRVRVFDVSDMDGQLLRLEYNSLGTGTTVVNGGWSFFMKTYEEGEEGMDPVPTPYADYDFQDEGHVLAHGWMDAAGSGLKHAYVRVPENARFLCLTYYNNASATSGQRCGYTLIEPVEYASKEENEELDTRVTQLSEEVEQTDATVKALTEELDFLADDLVSVGRTAKKYIIAETGALYSGSYGAAGRFYVSNYIDVSAISTLSYKIKYYCKQNAAVIAAYDEEKNYILENSVTLELKSSAKTASGTWTKGERTRYIRIGIDQNYPSHFVAVGGNIPDILKRVKALEDTEGETPDVVRNNPDMAHLLPQMRYRGNPAASAGGQNDSSTTVLLHFSDIHGQKGNMKNIVAFRDYYGRYIDDVLNTGDTVQNSFSNDTAQKQAGSEDFLTAIGNHDTTTGSYDWYYYVGLQAYEKFIKPYMFETIVDDETGTSETVNRWGVVQPEDADTEGYCWYYKDYASGVRLIVLDYMNAIEVQTQWLTGVLADAREKGKTVVIASHIVPGNWNALPCGMTQSQGTSSSSTYGGSAQFVRNVNAVHDFIEGGGKFVCWLAGHTHVDFVGVGIGTGTVKIDGETVAVNNTGQILVRVAMAAYNNTQTRVSREAGSASYDDFNIVCIDPSNKWLQLAKVGSQYNRALMRRSPVCIDYESGTIVWGEYKSNN